MELDTRETHGRRVLIEFTCYRCKTKTTRSLAECIPELEDQGYRGLYDFHPPKDWKNGGFYYPLFCGKCANEYERFMNGEQLKGREDLPPCKYEQLRPGRCSGTKEMDPCVGRENCDIYKPMEDKNDEGRA